MADPFPLSQLFVDSLTEEMIEKIKAEKSLNPPMAIFSLPGQPVEIIPLYQDRAIEILRAIAYKSSYDTERDECWFCKSDKWNRGTKDFIHVPNCAYFQAKELLEEIDNG